MSKFLKIISSIFFYLYNPFCAIFCAVVIYYDLWYLSIPIMGLACLFLFFYLKTHEKEIAEYSKKLDN